MIVAIPSYNIIFINIYHENWIRFCTLLIIIIRSTHNVVFVSPITSMKNGGVFFGYYFQTNFKLDPGRFKAIFGKI